MVSKYFQLISGLLTILLWGVDIPILQAKELSYLTITNGNKTDYEIVISNIAVDSVNEAAKELNRLLFKSTGADVPIVNSPTNGRNKIYIGKSEYLESTGFVDNIDKPDSYRISVINNDIFLIGMDDNKQGFYKLNNRQSASAGSYYSVLDFARRFLNARWYMPTALGEDISKISRLVIPTNLDIQDAPYFAMRYIDITNNKSLNQQKKLKESKRLTNIYFNKQASLESVKWGRHLRLGSNFELAIGHAWYKWIPAEMPNKYSKKVYGESNPGFYAVPGGAWGGYYYGKDKKHGGQLCICNDAVATVMAGNMIAYSKNTGETAFSLSPNDGSKWECNCDCCKTDIAKFKKGSSALTGEVIKFSNKVSSEVTRNIPDAKFGLYAYSWFSNPPNEVNVNPNITISDVYNGLPYQYYKNDNRRKIEKSIVNWRGRVNSIVLTSYYTFYGHYSLPWSTKEVHGWLIDMLANAPSSSGLRINYSQYDVPPMGLLGADPWVLSELLWNPHQDIEQLYEEFYLGAFGEIAGPLIKQCYDLIEMSMGQTVANMRFNNVRGVKDYILPAYETVADECSALINKAVLAVSSSEESLKWRVSRVDIAWQLAELTLDMLKAGKEDDDRKANKLSAQREALLLDEKSIFSLGRASSDLQNNIVPLLN